MDRSLDETESTTTLRYFCYVFLMPICDLKPSQEVFGQTELSLISFNWKAAFEKEQSIACKIWTLCSVNDRIWISYAELFLMKKQRSSHISQLN